MCCLELNHREAHQLHNSLPRETERQTADTKAKRPEFSSPGWLLSAWEAVYVSLPGSWITAAIEAQWGQSCSVCLGLLHRQEACEQSKASALFQSESAAQTGPNQLTFSQSLHKPPTLIMIVEKCIINISGSAVNRRTGFTGAQIRDQNHYCLLQNKAPPSLCAGSNINPGL